jgi:hypothetical protein
LIPIHKEARKQNKIKSVIKRDKFFIENEPFDKKKHDYLIKRTNTDASGVAAGDVSELRNEHLADLSSTLVDNLPHGLNHQL